MIRDQRGGESATKIEEKSKKESGSEANTNK